MKATQLSNLQVITEDNSTYNLYSGTTAEYLFLDGAGMPPVRRILQGSPLQHGMTDKGFRLEPRKMTLHLYISAESESALAAKLDTIAYIFGPTTTALKLKATRLDGVVRQIDCFVDGTADFPRSQQVGGDMPVTIPLVALDPAWYDPTQQVNTLAIPSTASYNLTLSTAGITWEDWPVLSITGPATTFTVGHGYNFDSFSFTSAIPAGETFVIDLRPGYKKVYRQSDNANRISYLNPVTLSAMATMRVFPEKWVRMLSGGLASNNLFFANGTGTTGATLLTVSWYKRYLNL